MLRPEFLRQLDNLRIIAKNVFRGKMKGERRSPKRGTSVEFADYRNYQIGDDFRYVDWNIYARLNKLFLKLFMDEENLNIAILLDVSRSMDFGEPSKLDYAKQLAAALGYIGLANFDMVSVCAFSDTIIRELPPVYGKGQIFKLFNFLKHLEIAAGKTDMAASFRRYLVSARPGVAIVISDFLAPEGYQAGLKLLRYRRFESHIIQVLSEEELNPTISGELSLADAETGTTKEITVTDKALASYRKRLHIFCDDLHDFCESQKMTYVRVSTEAAIENFILKDLRKAGVIG